MKSRGSWMAVGLGVAVGFGTVTAAVAQASGEAASAMDPDGANGPVTVHEIKDDSVPRPGGSGSEQGP